MTRPLLVFLPLLFMGCTAGSKPVDSDTDVSTGGDDTDATSSDDDDADDDGSADDSDAGADDSDAPATDVFVGCVGDSGTCSGLSSQACLVGQALGCVENRSVVCSPTVFCVTQLDGCPSQWCTADGQFCAWKDAAKQSQQAACSTYTDEASCLSSFCSSQTVFASCSGSWSCALDYSSVDPAARPEPGVCDGFEPYGFACDAVYE